MTAANRRGATGLHGGYVAAQALAAMRAELPVERTVRSLSTTFVEPTDDGPLVFKARVERSGRSTSITSYVAEQRNRVVLLGSASFDAELAGDVHDGTPMPEVIPVAEAEQVPTDPQILPFTRHFELRAADGVVRFGTGTRAELTQWVRFRDDRPLDAEAVTILSDIVAPGLFASRWARVRPTPSVELAVHYTDVVDRAERGWVLVREHTDHAAAGRAVDDCSVWTEDGRLLAVARQSRRVLPEIRLPQV